MDLSKIKREELKAVSDDLTEILAQTIADYEAKSGKTLQPAHIERLIINTYAYREMLTRKALNEAYRQQHPRFATGLMLDLCGDDVNTPRLEASASRCTIRFTLAASHSEPVVIPQSTQIAAGATVFQTESEGTLSPAGRTLDLEAVCTQTGVSGNGFAAGQINTLVSPIDGVSAANIEVSAGGADRESDDAYRQRILLAPESFSVAGPVGAYEYFARRVNPVICDVHVGNLRTAGGEPVGGRVQVTVLTKNGLPSSELIGEVQRALSDERIRPLCDTVSVAAPSVIDYTLDAELTLFTGTNPAEVSATVKLAWTNYEASRRGKLGADIVPLDIQTALKAAGVYNVVLKSPTLTVVQPDQWARCTSVNIRISPETAEG